MTPFIATSREELPIGDREARGRSALRLGDLQASQSYPRPASHDGGDVRSLAIWDLYFADEALRRLPRTAGISHFHTGWPGMSTLRLGRSLHQRQFHSRRSFDGADTETEHTPEQVQAAILAYAAALEPRWTIVLTRIVNEVPDPDGLIEALAETRKNGGGLVLTGMGCPLPEFVFNQAHRLGLPDWEMVRRWGARRAPLLSAIENTTITEQWPQHIVFGVAFSF